MPVFQKATLCWCLFVLSVKLTSGEWTDQIITEFRGGILGGMGGQCLDQKLLEVKKYEDFVEVFKGPDGANEFFASSSEGINKHCIENVSPFIGKIDYEVRVFVYTSNMGAPHSLSLSVNDLDSSEILRTEVEIVDKHWTMSIIKLKRTSTYKIRLEYTKGKDDEDTFFAIDKFVLRFPTPPEWTTTETPSTDSTDYSTPPTETPDTASPETNNPIIVYPESDTWKIISIVTLTICSCFIVFTVFLAYFYISIRQKLLASDKKRIEPVDSIPRVVNRKEVQKSAAPTILPVDQKSVTNSSGE